MFLLLLLLNVLQVLFKLKQLFKNTTQRRASRLDSYEWQGMWDSMGKYLGQWAPPVFWNFTTEQVQNPEKLVKYLEKVCCHPGNSRETQITALCWGLPHAYRALLNTIQYPQGEEKVSGSDDKTTRTAATPTAATGAVAEPENQPVPVSVVPIHKKKSWKQKSARLVTDDEKARPSRGEEEEELKRDGEPIVTWLLQCWDNRASNLELEGKEAKQLGSLSREGGIDKAIRKGAKALSLWRQLLSGTKEKYPFKEDVICHPGKWATMERGIQYLRELVVLEAIYSDLDNKHLSKDPDEVQCTRLMWQKFVQSAPPSYANSLAVMTWKGGEAQMVDELAGQLWQYEENLSSSLALAVEKLSWEFQQLKDDMSYSPLVQTSISAIRSKHSSVQERAYRGLQTMGYPVVLPA
ncbi:hypothetical protein QYF61_006007 [Mycteria americana]|uniref:Uncharacterized protein n=1 Tax=Mycteria americana TaxID=33587 RepID=A0AAN7N8X5_MYCAM|nr:hypothetical protein QYF61_006007 [Mycteria americana]